MTGFTHTLRFLQLSLTVFVGGVFLQVLILSALVHKAEAITPIEPDPETKVPKYFVNSQLRTEKYETWSLFLICNPEWLNKENSTALFDLYNKFHAFGRVIGEKNVAIWFWKKGTSKSWNNDLSKIPNSVDVYRSSSYCTKYGLLPSEGPHILVTTQYPDDLNIGDYFAISLEGLNSDGISSLLKTLADQILITGLDQEKLDSERVWKKWGSAIQSVLAKTSNLIKKVVLKINTKWFSLEIEGGQTETVSP